MKIYCFGNEFIEEDSMAREICSELNGFEFVKIDNVLDFIENNDSDLVIMDVVKGITRPRLFAGSDAFKIKPGNAHDLDLGFFLKLLKEIKKEKKVNIIGIPPTGSKEIIKKELKKILAKLNQPRHSSAAATA